MMFRPDHKKVIYTRASVPYGWAGALHWGVTTIFRPFLLERFVPDGINSVGDYNSPRVGVYKALSSRYSTYILLLTILISLDSSFFEIDSVFILFFLPLFFLVACTRLFTSLCRSVGRSVHRSVHNHFSFLAV